jgi:hypothetical protein
MYTTSLEKVLAESLARCTGADIPGIIAAAQECCKGVCQTVEVGMSDTVITAGSACGQGGTATQEPEKPKRTRIPAKEVAPVTPAGDSPATEPLPQGGMIADAGKPPTPVTQAPTVGIDLSGLFTGSGADKKVVKDVFLKAVDSAKTLAHLVALNATCDCGFATGDYTEETAAVLKRKLTRWGAAQE